MKLFIKDVLSEEGRPSSKRVAFFIFLFAFLLEIAYNAYTGKAPMQVLIDQLFYALQVSLLTIFGSNLLNSWKEIRTIQSNNNAVVGAPSPTPQPPSAAPVSEVTINK